MEKRGEILNQLAIISDLLENANLIADTKTVIFEVEQEEFNRIYKLITSKAKVKTGENIDRFSTKIGEVEFVFNKSNV